MPKASALVFQRSTPSLPRELPGNSWRPVEPAGVVFAVDPVGNDAEWFGFYRSQKRFERRVARAMLGEEADGFVWLLDALRKPKAADNEARLLLLGAILTCFTKPGGSDLAKILSLVFGDDSAEQSDKEIPEDTVLLLGLPSLLVRIWINTNSGDAASELPR
jgi:hypothetical protein